MISEISFSRSYSSLWAELTPWLSEYVSSLNKGFVERLEYPLDIGDDLVYRSTNNVIAFTLFKNSVISGDTDINSATHDAKTIIQNFPNNNFDTFELTKINKRIIEAQSQRLLNRYQYRSPVFYPQFPGCGIMEGCQGDLLYNDTLVEIKAGERGLLSSDIKQLITYCALNWLSKNHLEIDNIEVYNPRQGILWNASLYDVISSISDVPLEDLFDQIGKYLSTMSDDIEF